MKAWHFTEQPYYPAWGADNLRITYPNQLCEPEVASGLLNRYLDEWLLADELGLNIMVNEHHATATCMSASCTITLAILARQTRKARLLALGIPVQHRPDPLRVAEEIALIDLISRGRLEVGYVKGAPYEIPVSNINPIRASDRFWEAHDLIVKALTTHDAPFSWEGEYFNYRNVNVWPRCYQQPCPPGWMPTTSPFSAPQIARHKYVIATFIQGYASKAIFDTYRSSYLEFHGEAAPADRLAYMGMVAIGNSRAEARARAEKILGYARTSPKVSPQFMALPGIIPISAQVRALRADAAANGRMKTASGKGYDPSTASVEELIEAGVLFAGTPDDVFTQIKKFNQDMGGFGNLIMMGHGGDLSHTDTADNLTLFAREVYPRLQELSVVAQVANL